MLAHHAGQARVAQAFFEAVEAGSSAREAARRFAVSESAAIKLVRRVRETGSTEPARIGGCRKPLLAEHEARLRELTSSKLGITLVEIQSALTTRGIEAGCLTTIWSTLRRLDLSQKKSLRAAELAETRSVCRWHRPDVAEHRRLWRTWQRYMDPDRFVFIDETGASTNVVRLYGWAPRGERLVDTAPHGHWRTTTFVAGLRSTGLVAPLVFDGPINGSAFPAQTLWVSPGLRRAIPCPNSATRRCGRHGPAQIADLSAHKVASIKEAIRAAGASILYLPPYSPDLNPIEQVFAKLKTLLRRAAARTKETFWTTIGKLIGQFRPAECRNYLTNSGCEFT